MLKLRWLTGVGRRSLACRVDMHMSSAPQFKRLRRDQPAPADTPAPASGEDVSLESTMEELIWATPEFKEVSCDCMAIHLTPAAEEKAMEPAMQVLVVLVVLVVRVVLVVCVVLAVLVVLVLLVVPGDRRGLGLLEAAGVPSGQVLEGVGLRQQPAMLQKRDPGGGSQRGDGPVVHLVRHQDEGLGDHGDPNGR